MIMNRFVLGASVASLLSVPALGGVVLYDNFSGGDGYNNDVGGTIGYSTNVEQGQGFSISGGDFFLDSVVAAIGYIEGINEVTLTLFDDDGGAPGLALESVTLFDLPPGGGDEEPPSLFSFSGTTVLSEDVTYWLIASGVNDTSALLLWNFNDTGALLDRASRDDGGPWLITADATALAMRINGSPIPAPGALGLLGAAGLVSRRRRRA